jgi:hypothetical protein
MPKFTRKRIASKSGFFRCARPCAEWPRSDRPEAIWDQSASPTSDAKNMALSAARGFLTGFFISDQSGPYPMAADGSQLRARDTENCSAIE